MLVLCLTAVAAWAQPDLRMLRTDADHPPVPGLVIDETKPLMHRMTIFELESTEMFDLWIRFPELPRHKMLGFDLCMVNTGSQSWASQSNQVTRLYGMFEILTNTMWFSLCDRYDFWPFEGGGNHFSTQFPFPVWMDWRHNDAHGHQLLQTVSPLWTCVEISNVPDGRYFMVIMFVGGSSSSTGLPYIVLDITIQGFDVTVNNAPELGF